MSVKTLGTNANNSIAKALTFLHGIGSMPLADVATLNNAILDDRTGIHSNIPGSFSAEGSLLFVPRRGVLKMLAGDVVGVDSRGWPILLSADTIANGLWTLT